MTTGSNFFVFVALIASGSLIAACRCGQSTAPRQSSDVESGPDRGVCTPQTCESLGHACGTPQDGCRGILSCGFCDDGEMCSSGTCIDAPAKASRPPPSAPGTPYGHVVPADVGVTIGAGVIAAAPTAPYTGPSTITANGTTIENVVISDCLDLRADNITIRNVIIDCSDWFAIDCENVDIGLIEYSTINNNSGNGKGFRIRGCQGLTIRNNEISGGEDFVYGGGYPDANTLDNLRIENNYFHSMIGTASAHADGFQIDGDFGGNIYIIGNYFDPDNTEIGYTDLLFLNGRTEHFWYFANNYIKPFGWYTLRCGGAGVNCILENNIYAQEFKALLPAPGSPTGAVLRDNAPPVTYRCNRYEDGDFIEQQWMRGDVTHDITGCPSYP